MKKLIVGGIVAAVLLGVYATQGATCLFPGSGGTGCPANPVKGYNLYVVTTTANGTPTYGYQANGGAGTTTINGVSTSSFYLVGDGTTISSTVSGATTTFVFIGYNGNWAGTWQGNNSSSFALAASSSQWTTNASGSIYFSAGKVAIGTSTPIALLDVGNNTSTIGTLTHVTGTGLSDLTLGGTFAGNVAQTLKITIQTPTSTGDIFEWGVNGTSYGYSQIVASTTPLSLGGTGITLKFNAITGHTAGDSWTSVLTPSNGNINASNAFQIGESTVLAANAISGNTATGINALGILNTGTNNTADGYYVLNANSTGNYNTGVGWLSLASTTTGSLNTGVGGNALKLNTAGGTNTAVGYNAGIFNTTGNSNTDIGASALAQNQAGSNNTSIGVSSMNLVNGGNNNIAVGYYAGTYVNASSSANNYTGSNSIYLGYHTNAAANNDTNEIVIGYNALGLGSSTTVIGNSSTVLTALMGNVGIGTTAPSSTLHVAGNISLTGSSTVVTASIGGSPLLAGSCSSATSSIDSTVTSSTAAFVMTPQNYPGDGIFWHAYLSAAGVVMAKVCAAVAATPTATVYTIKIIK